MDWHNGASDFPSDLPAEAAATHIGVFLAWMIRNDLVSDLHKSESAESILKVKSGQMTGAQFLIEECDEKLFEEDLNEEGIGFARHYYDSSLYFNAYGLELLEDEPTIYHVRDSWENYDKVEKLIDNAFIRWQTKKNKKFWQFWL